MRACLIAALLFCSCAAAPAAIYLANGESYTFEFTSIAYSHVAGAGENSSIYARFSPGSLSLNQSIRFEVAADTLSQRGFDLWVFATEESLESGDLGFYFGSFGGGIGLWPDMQGVARITMFTGDGYLEGFEVKNVFNGYVYSQYYPVPEPGPCLITAIAALLFFRRKNRIVKKS